MKITNHKICIFKKNPNSYDCHVIKILQKIQEYIILYLEIYKNSNNIIKKI